MLLGLSLLMMLLGKEDEDALGREGDDDCISLFILKALFVAPPLIDEWFCCWSGDCDSLSNALGLSLIASSYEGGLDVTWSYSGGFSRLRSSAMAITWIASVFCWNYKEVWWAIYFILQINL